MVHKYLHYIYILHVKFNSLMSQSHDFMSFNEVSAPNSSQERAPSRRGIGTEIVKPKEAQVLIYIYINNSIYLFKIFTQHNIA